MMLVAFGSVMAIAEIIHKMGIPGLVSTMIGGPALAAIITWLLGRHKPKIEKRDADLGAAETSQAMSLALAKELREELTTVKEDLKTVRNDLTTESAKREALEDEVRQQSGIILSLRMYVARVIDWASWLHDNWQHIRQLPDPPQMPVYEDPRVPGTN